MHRCDEEDANAVSICVSSLNQTPRQKTNVDHLQYCCCLSLQQVDQIRKDMYNYNKERNLKLNQGWDNTLLGRFSTYHET